MIFFLLLLVACSSNPTPEAAPEEQAASTASVVVLSEEALANARLVVEPVNAVSLGGDVVMPAHITLDPRQEARVSAVTDGAIERIEVRPGDAVRAGTSLATVLSPDLGAAIGEHLSASAHLATAQAKQVRYQALTRDGFTSQAQQLDVDAELTVAVAEVEAAAARLRVFGLDPKTVRPDEGQHFSPRLAVRSPIAGTVLSIDAALGKSVSSGDPLFHIGNLDDVWLIVEVYERNLALVKVGSEVSFTVDAYGETQFAGKVDAVGDWLDPDSRTTEVRVVVANADHRLKPNMFAQAHLAIGSDGPSGLVVPADAVVAVDGKPAVFVEEAPERFRPVPVEVEPLAGGRVHILSGVDPGARVVVGGAFTLLSELGKSALEGD